ncbi:MAG: hypothetical protein WD397_12045 [Wenzhouxiangellaceae bacterium]
MKTRITVIALLALVLGGCGSIPLGTMWKMYRMGPEALYETDPTHVRVAAMSENWVLDRERFDWGALTVDVRIAGAASHDWAFVLEDVSRVELQKLNAAPDGQRWRVYRIRETDLESFQQMQAELPGVLENAEQSDGEGENTFQIGVSFLGHRDQDEWASKTWKSQGESVDPSELEELDQREIPYRLDLQLFPDDGFFPLIKKSTIPAAWLGIEKQES